MAAAKNRAARKSLPKGGAAQTRPILSCTKLLIAGLLLICAAILLFARLGHYALWDDEANTALHAKGVLLTGDTSAIIGHNLVAYRDGICLKNLCDRVTSPLSSYIVAGFMTVFGDSAFAVRLPFALFGLGFFGLAVWWLWKADADLDAWILTSIGLLTNVELFLYSRQCRYYSLAVLSTAAILYLYLYWKGTRVQQLTFVVCSLALATSNYQICFAFYAALFCDYLLWSRKRLKLTVPQIMGMFLPQLLIAGTVAWIWNPLATWGKHMESNGFAEQLYLFFHAFLDADRCEFAVGGLLILAPVFYFTRKDTLLLRGCLFIIIYIFAVELVTPQRIKLPASVPADVRYLVPLIPLSVVIAVRVIRILTLKARWLAVPLGVIAFGTNLLHGGLFFEWGLRSTIVQFAGELLHPPSDPYTETYKWIDANVAPNQSIWVLPNYMTYPLMYHAPKAIYAWQLPYPPEPQFANLPIINFRFQTPPDYLIAFGPVVGEMINAMRSWNKPGLQYQQVATLDCYWHDVYRPELFWRSFTPVTHFDRNSDAIYIFKRTSPPLGGEPGRSE